MERTVFISYAREDRARVGEITRYLKSGGWDVWVDEAGIRGGARWAAEIERAIGDSAVFLVVLSHASATSEWVDRELAAATDLRVPVVAVELEDSVLPSSMQFLLRNRQRVTLPTEENRLTHAGLSRLDSALIGALEEKHGTNPDVARLAIGRVLTGIGAVAIVAAFAAFGLTFFNIASQRPGIGEPEATVAGMLVPQAMAVIFGLFLLGMILAAIGRGLSRSARLRGVRWEMRRR